MAIRNAYFRDAIGFFDITIEKASTRKGRSKTFRVTRSSPLTDFTSDSTTSPITSRLKRQSGRPHEVISSDRAHS
ncbi:hypothetical protein PIB30_073439 [Stylosanthes scabra]|uniref:Uncharacterized protein n=1 Tax=Stylosanthes scabra TaxID=79078 RepID=A0ABU6VNW5_9FABA|nr:hypothetical protein [Stylosanthes scabra]